MANVQNLVSNEALMLIRNIINSECLKNYGIETSAGSVTGDNYFGLIAKVVVRGQDQNNKKKILNLIVKSAPRSGFMRYAPLQDLYKREIYFYDTIFREFAKFQDEKQITNPFKSIAKYYASLVNDANEVLIMENMKTLGYKLCDRRKVFDYNHILLALKEYGKFHAISFALRHQKPKLFEKLAKNSIDCCFRQTMCDDAIKNAIEAQGRRALGSLDPVEDKDIYEKLEKFVSNMMQTVPDSVVSDASDKYAVIGHGDCWINNLLFKYEDEKTPEIPTKICFLDWQLSRIGSPALDLSYLIFTSTDKDLRDEHYEDLIKEYYESLSNNLVELGSDPDKIFPFDALQDELKKYSTYGLYMAISIIFTITREADEAVDLNAEIDQEEFKEKCDENADPDEVYKSRMRGVICDFVKYNYL